MFPRRKTRPVAVGGVVVGGGAPIVVQAMTKTDTRDVRATVAQIRRLERAGAEIVAPGRSRPGGRRGAPGDPEPRPRSPHRRHPLRPPAGPGRSRRGGRRPAPQSREHRLGRPRSGRSSGRRRRGRRPSASGSTPAPSRRTSWPGRAARRRRPWPRAPCGHVRLLEDLDFRLIKISLKASDVPRTLEAYRLLAGRVDYPFHAGITEAGRLLAGSVKSSAGPGPSPGRGAGRHRPRLPDGPAREGGPRRLADPPGPGPPDPGRELRLLPHVRPLRGRPDAGRRPRGEGRLGRCACR